MVKNMSIIVRPQDFTDEKTYKKIMNQIKNYVLENAATVEAFQIDVTPTEVITPIKERKWYTTKDIAEMYQVTDRMVRKWCESGRIYAIQTPGGKWRIPSSKFADLDKVEAFRETVENINKRFNNSPEIMDYEK